MTCLAVMDDQFSLFSREVSNHEIRSLQSVVLCSCMVKRAKVCYHFYIGSSAYINLNQMSLTGNWLGIINEVLWRGLHVAVFKRLYFQTNLCQPFLIVLIILTITRFLMALYQAYSTDLVFCLDFLHKYLRNKSYKKSRKYTSRCSISSHISSNSVRLLWYLRNFPYNQHIATVIQFNMKMDSFW